MARSSNNVKRWRTKVKRRTVSRRKPEIWQPIKTIPKRSLNADIDAWVANGGKVVTVTDRMKHAPVVMNQRQRKLLKKDE